MEIMFTQMQQFINDVAQQTREQLARWDAVWPEVQRAQEQGVKRFDAAIDEAAQWGKQSLAMWAEMSRASLAIVRHGVESTLPRTPAA